MMEMNPKDMEIFQRVVMAGMKLMFSEKTFAMLKSGMTKQNVPLPQRLAMETAGIVKMLMEKSAGKIPVQLIAPIGAMLLMEMGKFMTEAGVAKPNDKDIAEGTGLLFKLLHKMYAGGGQQAAPQAPATAPVPPQPQPQQQQPPAATAGMIQGAM